MPTEPTTSEDFVLTVSEEERGLLQAILKHELGEVRVEAHHTDNLDYRDSVVHREGLIRGLLERIQQPQSS